MKAAFAVALLLAAAPVAPLAEAASSSRPESASIAPRLAARLSTARADERHVVWLFTGCAAAAADADRAEAMARLSPRALARRARHGGLGLTPADLPLPAPLLEAVQASGARVRHASRWLRALSVEADGRQIAALASAPCVSGIDLVARGRRAPEPRVETVAAGHSTAAARSSGAFDYGPALAHLAPLRVPEAHDLGLDGRGVVIAVLDAGFDNLGHEAFAGLRLVATRDFVNGDDDVGNGADRGNGSHGTAVLSVLAGFAPGQLIGPAHGASFLLAKTEDTESETPAEEDAWVAAAEWAEALGADVLTSSLGYRDFDPGFADYSTETLDGRTAISTRAANQAVDFGIVVLVSAGNQGPAIVGNTIGAPADGFSVLAIGAVDNTGARAPFSSVGPTVDLRTKPDLVAPGVSIRAAASSAADAYRAASGTSFSCPLAAGVVALVLQAHPEYTVAQVHEVLRATARREGPPDNLTGWGHVDALEAILRQATPTPTAAR